MKYKITFNDEIEADSDEQAYKNLIQYLRDCVKYEDVTAFGFIDENGKEY